MTLLPIISLTGLVFLLLQLILTPPSSKPTPKSPEEQLSEAIANYLKKQSSTDQNTSSTSSKLG